MNIIYALKKVLCKKSFEPPKRKKSLVWTLSPQCCMLLLFIDVMLFRKAAYPNPALILLIQAHLLQR